MHLIKNCNLCYRAKKFFLLSVWFEHWGGYEIKRSYLILDMAAPVLTLVIFYVIQFVFPSRYLFETSKFVKKGEYHSIENIVWRISIKQNISVDLMITIVEFIFSEVCSDRLIKLDKPPRKMLASICETQCMIVCHQTEGNYKACSKLNIW